MTETELLEEASNFWDNGHRSEALHLMKLALRNDPSQLNVRRALAERYREMGNPDQAGRWGIVFDGWTTDVERDRLARLLGSSGIAERHARKFLALNDDQLPDNVVDLISGPGEQYRRKFEVPVQGIDLGVLGSATAKLWGLTFVILIVGMLAAPFGSDPPLTAGILGILWMASVTVAFGFTTASALVLRSTLWTITGALGTIAMVGLTLLRVRNG